MRFAGSVIGIDDMDYGRNDQSPLYRSNAIGSSESEGLELGKNTTKL